MAATPPHRVRITAASMFRCSSTAVRSGVNLGTRATLSDIGQTVAENFGARLVHGTSFLSQITACAA